MLWYMLKTWGGGEESLIQEIRRTVPAHMYRECFVIRQERIWRRQQRSIVHVENLFPGCVFITCDKTVPLFRRMEMVPAMARLMASGEMTVLPLMEEDVEFLEKLSGKDHMVELSTVQKDEEGRVSQTGGPLALYLDEMKCCQFKKRYAVIRHRLWGEERNIPLGIVLKEDAEQKLIYEDMTVPVEMPEAWMAGEDYLWHESAEKGLTG